MRIAAAAVLLAGCAPLLGPARWAATVEQSSGSCCSQSCGASSTVARVTLELAPDGAAEAVWSRRGCVINVSGEGQFEMPYAPGPPEAVCTAEARTFALGDAPARLERTPLDGAGRLHGRWRRAGGGTRIDLTPDGGGAAWSLRCARAADPTLAACRFTVEHWPDTAGFTVGAELVLGREPGLRVSSSGLERRARLCVERGGRPAPSGGVLSCEGDGLRPSWHDSTRGLQ